EGASAVAKLPSGAFFVVDGVLAFDKARDVAVIKAHGTSFRTVTLGNSDRVEVGQEVVAIGNPLALESTVSNGIVSGIRKDEDLGGKFLQITTPISPGSSGGPLFNMEGRVVGITTMYLRGGENLNFAIPINDAKRLLFANSSKLQNFPIEPEAGKNKVSQSEVPLPPDAIVGPTAPATARAYFEQLYDAGGILDEDFVCFNDDYSARGFFAFRAFQYDEKHPDGNKVDKEMPYVFFVPEEFFKLGILNNEEFFVRGGRILEMSLYSAGVKTGTDEYRWDGHSWVFRLTSRGPLGPVTSVYRLIIEPATMRYTEMIAITDDSDAHAPPVVGHPRSGSCELIPARN
ncbi:MAG TPA: trypsin-like peptidase domain-containing protein, partial [Phototrophicaceae bacterium]|nr:trypsin-like peptidase domain-containing protein [Phototrophicaceae bacterium]